MRRVQDLKLRQQKNARFHFCSQSCQALCRSTELASCLSLAHLNLPDNARTLRRTFKLKKKTLHIDYSETPCYGHLVELRPLFLSLRNVHTFSYKKTVNTANGHILKSQLVWSFITLPRLHGNLNQLYIFSSLRIVNILHTVSISIKLNFIN